MNVCAALNFAANTIGIAQTWRRRRRRRKFIYH